MSLHDPEWRSEVESAVEFLSLIDADDRLVYVNHAVAADYHGIPVFDFILPEYHELARSSMEHARSSGYPQHYDSEAAGPDGGTSFYSNWIFPVSHPDADVLAFVATDVTALRRVESELERTDITFRSLVDHVPDKILIADRDRRLSFVNHLELGYELADVMGRQVETFVPDEDRARVAAEIDAVIETGRPRSYETTVNSPTGDYVFSTRAGPILVDGHVDGVVMISTDITDRLEAERERELLNAQLQQSQKMEALGQLTGGVAHDFNNLLTAIGGNLELVQGEVAPGSSGSERLTEAMRAVDQAADLIRRLLVFARNQPLKAKPERIDLLIAEMAPLLGRTLGESINVQVATTGPLWPCAIDRGQLEQALLNLAVNARDAMPLGGTLEIISENIAAADRGEQLPGGDCVSLTVRDTGIGMDPEIAEQAFEPFFTTKDPGRGTGLGLSMVYGFVSQSGGQVALNSQPGVGTEFRIVLPRTVQSESEDSPDTPPSLHRGAGEVVLVVEDQPLVREACLLSLEKLGYVGVEASDASEALAVLADHDDIAVVLSDFGLPGEMNGIELAGHVGKLEPPLPVVLMSGYADPAVMGTQLPDGIRFLQKPFKQAELAASIADVLAQLRLPKAPTSRN